MHSTQPVRAWELIALTVGLEPAAVGKPGTERYDAAKITDPEARAEFTRRLDDLTYALDSGAVPVRQHYAHGPSSWVLLAGHAAEFARSQGWHLPQAFDGLRAPDGSVQATEQSKALPDQWKAADSEQKRALAAEMVKRFGSQAAAAKALGISRQRLAAVLRNDAATVAPDSIEQVWKPLKA